MKQSIKTPQKMKTLTKKILLTKTGLINKSVANMISNCRFDSKTNKIYTGYYSGSGRFTTACSASSTIEAILKAQSYKFTKSNDAPMGGIKGENYKVSKIAFDFLKSIK